MSGPLEALKNFLNYLGIGPRKTQVQRSKSTLRGHSVTHEPTEKSKGPANGTGKAISSTTTKMETKASSKPVTAKTTEAFSLQLKQLMKKVIKAIKGAFKALGKILSKPFQKGRVMSPEEEQRLNALAETEKRREIKKLIDGQKEWTPEAVYDNFKLWGAMKEYHAQKYTDEAFLFLEDAYPALERTDPTEFKSALAEIQEKYLAGSAEKEINISTDSKESVANALNNNPFDLDKGKEALSKITSELYNDTWNFQLVQQFKSEYTEE